MERGAKAEKNRGNLKWWQLSLLGVASTIGTGYFLGSALGIRLGGPAFVLSIGIAAAATYFVFDVLARMTLPIRKKDPSGRMPNKRTADGPGSPQAGCTGVPKCSLWEAK
ncbi:amino acid permease [Paenibacillus sp. JCM 10914]|nr:amino acid permease [Paenibacillus sp. JCM 10914]